VLLGGLGRGDLAVGVEHALACAVSCRGDGVPRGRSFS